MKKVLKTAFSAVVEAEAGRSYGVAIAEFLNGTRMTARRASAEVAGGLYGFAARLERMRDALPRIFFGLLKKIVRSL